MVLRCPDFTSVGHGGLYGIYIDPLNCDAIFCGGMWSDDM